MQRILLLLLLCLPVAATQIRDTLYTPFGTLWAGDIYIVCPSGRDAMGRTIREWKRTLTVVGVISVNIDPGDAGAPKGRVCQTKYVPKDNPQGAWTEAWAVRTSSTPLKIPDVQTDASVSEEDMIQPSQIAVNEGDDGKYMCSGSGTAGWCTVPPGSGITDPTTDVGDLIFRSSAGLARLPAQLGYLRWTGMMFTYDTPPGTTDHAALQHLDFDSSGHTGFQRALGFTAVATTDPRLSDARNPLAHVHLIDDITGLGTALSGKQPSLPGCISDGQIWKRVSGSMQCASDETGAAGGGITSLNGLQGSAQTFAKVDDTNVTLTIGSADSTHTWTLGWTGALAKTRQHANTLYSDGSYSDPSWITLTKAKVGLGNVPNVDATAFTPTGNIAATTVAGALAELDGEKVATTDARLSDARIPTAHAASHGTGQGDPISPASIGAPELSLLPTLGDLPYRESGAWARLPGNTLAAKRLLCQTGTGSASAPPLWCALAIGDIPDLSTLYQPIDTDLTAYAALSAAGLVTRTGSGTVAARTLTGTANRLSVTNGDGVSGNPTLDVGSNIIDKTAANTYSAGAKQSFAPNATSAGVNDGSYAGDPSTLSNGDRWYNSSTNRFRCRENGATVDCVASGGGMTNPMTTANDMIVGGTNGTPTRLAAPVVTGHASLAFTPVVMGWVSATIPRTDLTASALTQNVNAFNLPANTTVLAVRVKESTTFAGGSSTALAMSLGTSTNPTAYMPAVALKQTVSSTNIYWLGGAYGADSAAHTVVAAFTATGANVNTFTAGAESIELLIVLNP